LARPDDDQERKEAAQEFLRELVKEDEGKKPSDPTRKLKCQKLLMTDGACFFCKENPRKEKPDLDWEALEKYEADLALTDELRDSVLMAFSRELSELDPDEWEMLRIYNRLHPDKRRLF
jgi:galactose-1-phosphate uridylyltransferase